MLTNLTISQFSIVDHLHIEFQPGMTAITGETGAGKSLSLDALSMVLGARADSQSIRHGADKAIIIAEFDIEHHPHIIEWLQDNDLATGENECLLKRTITREGRSKASINGLPVNLQKLRELGVQLVDMHSQHAHHKLLQREEHEKLLDAFAGITTNVDEVRQCHVAWKAKQQTLTRTAKQLSDAENRKEYLKFQLQEFESLAMTDGEYAHIEKRHQQLANAEQLQHTLHEAINLCEGDSPSVRQQLQRCEQLITPLSEQSDELQDALNLLDSAAIQIEEACLSLKQNLESLQASPNELMDLETRLTSFHDLARKHKCKPDELPVIRKNLEDELDNLQQGDDTLIRLEQEVQKKAQEYHKLAMALSHKRELAARTLSKRIKVQLAQLGMGNCDFTVALNHNQENAGNTGYDAIEFLVSTNPGQPALPLQKVASGGELSRISLAIQVIIAETTATPVLVFDEVDVGIGGATAEVVGRLMKSLGKKSQIISVTHQPQVASLADRHLIAAKRQIKKQTTTRLAAAGDTARVKEIARMLGGVEITDRTLDHAREMLAL